MDVIPPARGVIPPARSRSHTSSLLRCATRTPEEWRGLLTRHNDVLIGERSEPLLI
jgi:hypothetical protein